MATYEYSCRLLKPDRRGSIQPGVRMWDPLHWNYTELIPAGAKLACEYSRLSGAPNEDIVQNQLT